MRRWVVLCSAALPLVAVGILATGVSPSTAAVVYLAAVTPWITWYDLREHRIPNALVVPAIGLGLASCAGEWLASGRPPIEPLVAGAGCTAFLLLLNLMGGMGMGDVKLGAALGLASWSPSVAVLSPVIAFFVGGIVSAVLLTLGRRGARIAFGPFLLGGFWVAVGLVAVSRL